MPSNLYKDRVSAARRKLDLSLSACQLFYKLLYREAGLISRRRDPVETLYDLLDEACEACDNFIFSEQLILKFITRLKPNEFLKSGDYKVDGLGPGIDIYAETQVYIFDNLEIIACEYAPYDYRWYGEPMISVFFYRHYARAEEFLYEKFRAGISIKNNSALDNLSNRCNFGMYVIKQLTAKRKKQRP